MAVTVIVEFPPKQRIDDANALHCTLAGWEIKIVVAVEHELASIVVTV